MNNNSITFQVGKKTLTILQKSTSQFSYVTTDAMTELIIIENGCFDISEASFIKLIQWLHDKGVVEAVK